MRYIPFILAVSFCGLNSIAMAANSGAAPVAPSNMIPFMPVHNMVSPSEITNLTGVPLNIQYESCVYVGDAYGHKFICSSIQNVMVGTQSNNKGITLPLGLDSNNNRAYYFVTSAYASNPSSPLKGSYESVYNNGSPVSTCMMLASGGRIILQNFGDDQRISCQSMSNG